MADLTTVRAKLQAALDENDAALGQPTTTQQISDLTSKVTALTSQNTELAAKAANLQSIIDKVRVDIG